ncbi:hypothetical protein [Robertkochia aurantiaca]|uniref:hypothetical protein n=1 Tax=Robertkochia aurantiaca TaxID=2873700 RepID=UPI001CCD7A29|nr:hypothetical protein [Robertkochia sp. 3YJGBD-33]
MLPAINSIKRKSLNSFLRILLPLSLIVFTAACENTQQQSQQSDKKPFDLPDSLSSHRIDFVLKLRDTLGNRYWEGFNKKPVEGTFVYYNGDYSEIFFPDSITRVRLKNLDYYSEDYALATRIDTIPYHFEVMISLDPVDSNMVYYNHPVQRFLSVEETGKYIPSVRSTEMWTTMVMHEMFHHYQYNTPELIKYVREEIAELPFDSRHMKQICEEDPQFLAMVQYENQLLLCALEEPGQQEKYRILENYLKARERRLDRYSEAHPHLKKVEDYYVLQEGSARYMEFLTMKTMYELQNANLYTTKADPGFKNFEEFREFDLSMPDFRYLKFAGSNSYHYAIGFNLMRVLDQLGVDYKQRLLSQPQRSLSERLENKLDSFHKN